MAFSNVLIHITLPNALCTKLPTMLKHTQVPSCDNGYCKFRIVRGDDWQLLEGFEDGVTQVTRQSSGASPSLVWNFPLDVTYKSTNVFGWPQLVVAIYGIDGLGRDVVQGYGCAHLPTVPGRHTVHVRLFRPVSSSALKQLVGWLTGMPAEFADPELPARGEGREVTRVASGGSVSVRVNVLHRDMGAFGYEAGTVRADVS